jgi:chorismate mutase
LTKVRGVRGATTTIDLSAEAIEDATLELVSELLSANAIDADDIAAVTFTTSPDLNADFPARSARESVPGWEHVPLINTHEMSVPHGQKRCIRVLVLWNTDKSQKEIKHMYLREAHNLRQRAKPN